MKKSIIILLFVMLLLPAAGQCQFGIGQVILLGKLLAQDALIYGKTSQTAGNTGQIFSTANRALDLANQMSRTVNTLRYQGLRTLLWQVPYLMRPDVYGHAAPWIEAAQGRMPASQAYQYATIPAPTGDYASYYTSASVEQRQRIAAEYALLQDTDAENASALQAIGDSNSSIPHGQVAVNNLVQDSFASGFASSNPQLSQIALAQKQDISSTMGVQVQLQNQQLLSHILHELILMNTRLRNQEADRLQSDRLLHEHQEEAARAASSLGSTMASFRY